MNKTATWWQRPRRIAVVIDNDEWMLPCCEKLVDELVKAGDEAQLCREFDDIQQMDVSFFLSCHHIVSAEVLARSRRNLVVHASPLPAGRGMSPLTWQVLEGKNEIPLCLLEAAEEVDSGNIIYQEQLVLAGHELIDEMRRELGRMSLALCNRFLQESEPPQGEPQQGLGSRYPRRTPTDSKLDTDKGIGEQFELLRVVDNQRYPAWFEHRGQCYRLTIEKIDEDGENNK